MLAVELIGNLGGDALVKDFSGQKYISFTTYAVVGTAKATGIRKVISGGFRSKESAEKRLNLEKNDKYLRGLFRYLKVAKEEYKPRREGSLGKTLSHEPQTGKSDDI